MVTKRALQQFERYFQEELGVEQIHDTPRLKESNFKFLPYVKHSQVEYDTQITVKDSSHSFVEFTSKSAMISTIVIEEGVDFKLDFYAHENTVVLLRCKIQKGASCIINGYYSCSDMRNWIYIELLHEGEESQSDLNVLGYVSNKAHCVNDGLVQIGRGAKNSKGYQSMNNIILSNDAKIFSEPQLEIFNPNVECSHGCAIAPISEETLYYLQSRGITHEEGVRLLEDSMYVSFLERAGVLVEEE